MSGSVDTPQPAAQLPVPQDEGLLDPSGKNFFNNLLLIGGNIASASNARVGGGFLANPGWSAFSVGLGQSVRDRAALTRQNIENQNALQTNAASAMKNQATAALLPGEIEVGKAGQQYNKSVMEHNLKMLGQPNQGYQQELPLTTTSPTIAPAGTSPQSSLALPLGTDTSALKPNIIAPHDKIALIHSATVDRGLPEGVGLVLAGLPDAKGLVNTESGSDAHAVNKETGAIGLGQILPSTARKPGYGMAGVDNPSELFDPQKNLNFSADYLYNRGKQQFGMTDADWAGKTPEAQKKIMALVGAYGGFQNKDPTAYVHQVLGRMYGNSHVAAGTDPTTAPDGTPITGMVSRAPIPATLEAAPEASPTVEAGAPDQGTGAQVAGPGAGPSPPSGSSGAGLGVTVAPDTSQPATKPTQTATATADTPVVKLGDPVPGGAAPPGVTTQQDRDRVMQGYKQQAAILRHNAEIDIQNAQLAKIRGHDTAVWEKAAEQNRQQALTYDAEAEKLNAGGYWVPDTSGGIAGYRQTITGEFKPTVTGEPRFGKLADGSTVIGYPGGKWEVLPANRAGMAASSAAEAQGTQTGKAAGELPAKLMEIGQRADASINNIDTGLAAAQRANEGGLATGYFAPWIATGAAMAKSLGIELPGMPDPKAVSDIQQAQKSLAITSGALLDLTIGKGQITDAKIAHFIHTQPGIETDPQAIQRILTWARSQFMYEREMAMDGMANVDKTTGMLPPGWQANFYHKKGAFAPIYDPLTQETKQPQGEGPAAEPPKQTEKPTATMRGYDAAVKLLKENPGAAAAFDKRYGAGAAARELGR